MWLIKLVFLNSANLICRSTDISNYFRESLGIRDNESRLYIFPWKKKAEKLPSVSSHLSTCTLFATCHSCHLSLLRFRI